MKTYDFDAPVHRRNTACVKYDGVYKAFNLSPQEKNSQELLPMWVADMDFRTPDFIMDAIQERCRHQVLGYSFGNEAYWTAILRWFQTHYSISTTAEELHFIPGIVAGIAFALQAFTAPGDKVLVTTPVYPPFLHLPQGGNRTLVCNPLQIKDGRFHLDKERFQQDAQGCKLFILSNPHNPGGTSWSQEELLFMAEVCERNGILVIADEIHADLTLPGHHHISYSTVCEAARRHSITFIAPSKTFNIAGLSSSVCYCPNAELRSRFFTHYLDAYEVANGNLFAFVGATAAFSPEGEAWLQQLLAYLQGQVDFLREWLPRHLPKARAVWPEAGFLLWLDFSGYGLSHQELQQRLLHEARVALNDGTTFGPTAPIANNSPYANHFRLNFGCPRALLQEALNRIAAVLEP